MLFEKRFPSCSVRSQAFLLLYAVPTVRDKRKKVCSPQLRKPSHTANCQNCTALLILLQAFSACICSLSLYHRPVANLCLEYAVCDLSTALFCFYFRRGKLCKNQNFLVADYHPPLLVRSNILSIWDLKPQLSTPCSTSPSAIIHGFVFFAGEKTGVKSRP